MSTAVPLMTRLLPGWLRAALLATSVASGGGCASACPVTAPGASDVAPVASGEQAALDAAGASGARDAAARRASQPASKPAPRPESEAQVAAAADEARRLTTALLGGGIARREVTSVVDIRGHRLLSLRRYRQARVWFEVGVAVDPSFEPCLYNAAHITALLGDGAAARGHLQRLRRLQTPMSRRMLAQAARDPLLGPLLAARPTAAPRP